MGHGDRQSTSHMAIMLQSSQPLVGRRALSPLLPGEPSKTVRLIPRQGMCMISQWTLGGREDHAWA